MTRANLVALLSSALLTSCCIPHRYEGDGRFVDKCRPGMTSFGFKDRYVLDLGELDLGSPSEREFHIGGLPRAGMWILGLDVAPDATRPGNALLDAARISIAMDNPSGRPVISEALPIDRWQWQLTGDAEEGVGPSWVYLAGRTRDVPIGQGSVRVEPVGVLADGGWGTYFKPSPATRFVLRVRVDRADPDAKYFKVKLLAVGSDEIGSL